MKAIILAGGSGERFWPLSTRDQPKQFLRLFDDISLIRATFERLRFRLQPSDIIVVTSNEHRQLTIDELPEILPQNIIGEPKRMNTAAACVVGSLLADDGEQILTVPADHLIPDPEEFWAMVDLGSKGIQEHDGLFTFGIKPSRPETGYGYIESGDLLMDGVMSVRSFREKPNIDTAREFLDSKRFLWNSGMFLWKKEGLIHEMKKWCSDVITPLEGIDPCNMDQLKKAYDEVKRISIDYALMERSDKVRVVPTGIEWSDLGSWESIVEVQGYSEEDEKLSLYGSERILVRSQTKRKIAVVGLEDVIIVDTPDGLLVLNRDSSQQVREASRYLNLPL